MCRGAGEGQTRLSIPQSRIARIYEVPSVDTGNHTQVSVRAASALCCEDFSLAPIYTQQFLKFYLCSSIWVYTRVFQSCIHTHWGQKRALGLPLLILSFTIWGPVFSGSGNPANPSDCPVFKPSRLDYRHLMGCSVCEVNAEVWALVLMILHQML